jgi:transposase
MLNLDTAHRYLLYQGWADARKSFDGLSGIVTNEMKLPLQTGDVFIFINRRRTHIKLLQWEGDGYGMYYKRLEEGTFELPMDVSEGCHLQMTPRQLMLILQGVSLKKAVYRKRYIPRQAV